ncbi:MAG: flagellar hook protein FlgE [Synergistaceae bacterium]|jgi:flagellar hook protein FlgE|nr:flagellar hook protein FlgE [Synergistaceae bacterium]
MLRSLYSAVSGVKGHQTYLDVTGNNIANVNTVGFKRDVLHFRDMIYQSAKNPSAPNSAIPIGGVNPAQVGLGTQVGSIEHVFTQGSLQSTGIPTDMAISGEGFFVVQNGGQTLYTRAGNFALDRDGNLVMQGNGYMVQGYEYDENLKEFATSLSNVNIPIGQKIPAKATTLVSLRCNLCSTASIYTAGPSGDPGIEVANTWATKADVYDSKGTKYTMEVAFRKTAENEWAYKAYFVSEDGKIYDGTDPEYPDLIDPTTPSSGTMVFNADGLLKEVKDSSGVVQSGGALKFKSKFSEFGADDTEITIDFRGDVTEENTKVPKEDSGLDGVTQYDSPSTTKIYYQDGYTMGTLENWSVSQTGIITGTYSNGQTQQLAKVALAMFANSGGLLKVGETCFAETVNSGMAQIGSPMEGGAGSVQGNTIEMSNVDLSEEFVNLIRAQRGFQANTRVVTTSDQVLEELINMKR